VKLPVFCRPFFLAGGLRRRVISALMRQKSVPRRPGAGRLLAGSGAELTGSPRAANPSMMAAASRGLSSCASAGTPPAKPDSKLDITSKDRNTQAGINT
jgi:nitroreductase